jgi:uncharacterized repeat protein (TIGR01451 family)
MRKRLAAAAAMLSALVLVGPAAASSSSGVTELVSVSSAGEQANAQSSRIAINGDGRFAAFDSFASNLVLGDTNGEPDVFLRDREAGTTDRVSVGAGGIGANGFGVEPTITGDGRFVGFTSDATNLVGSDTNGEVDVFLRDREAGTNELLSVSSAGEQGDDSSFQPDVSADGHVVAFASIAANLVPGDTNRCEFAGRLTSCTDIFVRDRVAGTTERVSVSSAGEQANSTSDQPAISADGRFVVFTSRATNLVPGDTNDIEDVFVHDRVTGTTERVNVSSAGEQADIGLPIAIEPDISADGRVVAFASFATNLVPGDTNASFDVFVRDRVAGTTERVSVDAAGAQANHNSGVGGTTLSGDARFVAFSSVASNLVAADTNLADDVFVKDRQTGAVERVSVDSAGAQANAGNSGGTISGDGTVAGFTSLATNLLPDDTNSSGDAFVRDNTPPAFDLAVRKSDSADPTPIGRPLRYTIAVRNNGSAAMPAVRLTDTLPSSVLLLSFSASQGACTDAPGAVVTCELGTLEPGATATVTIDVRPTRKGTITNTVTVTGGQAEPNVADNRDTETTTVVTS